MRPYFDDSGMVAITHAGWRQMCDALDARDIVAARVRAVTPTAETPGVAILPVIGAITKGSTWYTDIFGGAPLDRLQAQLAAALADTSVSGIVLHVDSPGGGVYGVEEAAASIAYAAARKPVVAYTDGQMASAAYWLSARATSIVAAPTAQVGSIGVYALHLDESKWLADQGVTPTLIKAGEHKASGHPYFPLSDEDKAAFQADVDDYFRMFTAGVARGRGVSVDVVRGASFGKGRVVMASAAKAAGMVDEVGTFADALALVRQSTSARSAARAAVQDEQVRVATALALAGA